MKATNMAGLARGLKRLYFVGFLSELIRASTKIDEKISRSALNFILYKLPISYFQSLGLILYLLNVFLFHFNFNLLQMMYQPK